jgi:hypothetical protein
MANIVAAAQFEKNRTIESTTVFASIPRGFVCLMVLVECHPGRMLTRVDWTRKVILIAHLKPMEILRTKHSIAVALPFLIPSDSVWGDFEVRFSDRYSVTDMHSLLHSLPVGIVRSWKIMAVGGILLFQILSQNQGLNSKYSGNVIVWMLVIPKSPKR